MFPKEMLGKGLEKFSVVEMIEVFSADEAGGRKESAGLLRDREIANLLAARKSERGRYQTRNVLVLTDGSLVFLLGEEVTILNEGEVADNLRRMIIGKLSPAERKLVGLQA